MSGFRSSVASLLGLVFVAAMGFAGMRSEQPWAGAASLATIGTLAIAALGPLKGPRPLTLGFALSGSGYLFIARLFHVPRYSGPPDYWLTGHSTLALLFGLVGGVLAKGSRWHRPSGSVGLLERSW